VKKSVKRGLAAILAALMMIPVQPIMAATAIQLDSVEQKLDTGAAKETEDEPVKETVEVSEETKASSSNAVDDEKKVSGIGDAVIYNTGTFNVCVTDEEKAENIQEEIFIDVFNENGDYTINLPELNPFFPYEVQFTYKGKTKSQWFMTPDDSVTVGGHTFYVNAEFDGTAMTQMSLEVGGEEIVVYPEAKEFSDNGGIMPMSLLPLTEKKLEVDLTGWTPAELTRVKVASIFNGENALESTDKVSWTLPDRGGYYKTSTQDGYLDLSQKTYSGDYTNWEMIVGDDDQLAADNIRYIVKVKTTNSRNWLIPFAYGENVDGSLTKYDILEDKSYYSDSGSALMRIYVKNGNARNCGFRFKINPEVFPTPRFDHFKVYVYKTGSPTEDELVAHGTDVTNAFSGEESEGIIDHDSSSKKLYMLTYDADGNMTGNLGFHIVDIYRRKSGIYSISGLYSDEDGGQRNTIADFDDSEMVDSDEYPYICILEYGYKADEKYKLVMDYELYETSQPSLIAAAYVGTYQSMEEAEKAGAVNIKDELFNRKNGGYAADYSKGVSFTAFASVEGEDGTEVQKAFHWNVKTKEGSLELESGSLVYFYGFNDKNNNGQYVNSYIVEEDKDSYAEKNFLTAFVPADTDLTNLAPEFYTSDKVHLYAEGSSTPEISGESAHDFSKGPVQYTASAENGKDSKNYWLRVIKAEEGSGKLYINSLSDKDANTREENGTIYSTREMFLDGRYDYEHNILLANIGTEDIPKLSVELVSDQVKLDDYWTLKGNYSLAGLGTIDKTTSYGEIPNLAMLRLEPKDNVEEGTEISGTLTLKSDDKVLMVLNLTGAVGDPSIITKDIPDAVKYVPYGTMIQNNNKYSWNTVKYSIIDGALPGGMVLKPNGELYGVPTETGEFSFTVSMRNSYSFFESSERSFTFTVIDNTDANVDGATDQGYDLTQRVHDITLRAGEDQTMVSQGVFDQFVDVFLDGVKLTKGVDYSAESGSTRITIRSQTLKASNKLGTHTIGVEFRTKDTNTLKRAAQNYRVTSTGSSSSSGSSSGGSYSSVGGSRTKSISTTMISMDAKKGHVHAVNGIITGDGEGYSKWIQDEKGWKLMYADGTFAMGHMAQLADGSSVEQILWELINGSWYAFGVDGYLKSGWVYDYQLNSWYSTSVENGMRSGWYTDPQDSYTYYMDAKTGKLALGWLNINDKWYYFNAVVAPRTWEFDKDSGNWYYNVKSTNQPYGSLYRNGKTPDGYQVDENGAWKEE